NLLPKDWVIQEGCLLVRRKIVALHARLDDAQARYTGDWMKSSLDLGIAEEILAERLAHDPMDFIALRQQQNRAFKDGDDKRLKELEQLFQGHPDSDAAVFLSLRQMPPGRKRNEKTLATQKRFQDSHLLTSAMMRVQIQQELFVAAEQTLRRLMMSKKISSDRAALELLRLSRLQNADVPINPQQQARTYDSFPVASMYQQGQADPATFGVFWVYMDAGNFEKAAKWLQENEASENAIPWKWIALALCVPDNDEIVQHALNLQPSDDWYSGSLVAGALLAERNQQPVQPFLDALSMTMQNRQLADSMRKLLGSKSYDDCESLIRQSQLQNRGIMMQAILIRYPKETPAEWWDQSRQLLFINERIPILEAHLRTN
ncbi:MAG: hypothetical protein AAFP69_16870, partial [Planctomycetota bacterium]